MATMQLLVMFISASALLAPFATGISVGKGVDFENRKIGTYTPDDLNADWAVNAKSGDPSGAGQRLRIVEDPIKKGGNKVLEVTYKAKKYGGDRTAMVFDAPLGGKYDHLFFQYRVMFRKGFDWKKGGKLPGLTSQDSPTGCLPVSKIIGFSARLMWRANGAAEGYIYNPTKDGKENCGASHLFQFNFAADKWYTIRQEVKMSTPGKDDGSITYWVDGAQMTTIKNINLRKNANAAIEKVKMDTFFGGGDSSWAPKTDQVSYFDDFKVSTS